MHLFEGPVSAGDSSLFLFFCKNKQLFARGGPSVPRDAHENTESAPDVPPGYKDRKLITTPPCATLASYHTMGGSENEMVLENESVRMYCDQWQLIMPYSAKMVESSDSSTDASDGVCLKAATV